MKNKIDRRDFLGKLGKGMVALGAAGTFHRFAAGDVKKKPNVLMIIIDDLRNDLGCYGAKHIKSPHIDRLASQSLLFDHAYVQQSLCAPSRASVLTGCRPDTTGVYKNPYTKWYRKVFLKSHPDVQTFFHRQGYYTATFGKVHHGGAGPTCSEPHYASPIPLWVGKDRQHGGPKPPVEMCDKPDSAYRDGDVTDKAVDALRIASKKKEPFFMAVGYEKPHLPFACPQKYGKLYNRETIELSRVPGFPKNAPPYSHRGSRYRDPKGNWVLKKGSAIQRKKYIPNPGGFTDAFQKELIHGYYACTSFIDAQVGRLLSTLKKQGMWDNTVILLWSDNGFHLGDHNWWTKANNCEFDTRVPVIFRVPGQTTAGRQTDALIETVDFYPTLLDACGFPIPDYIEGTSFMPLVESPRREWKQAAFSLSHRGEKGNPRFLEGRSVRTRNYRYTEWRAADGKVRGRELYDCVKDPLETVNVAEEQSYREQVVRHREILKGGWKNALPPGVVNRSNNPPGKNDKSGKTGTPKEKT